MSTAPHDLTLDVAIDLIYFGASCEDCKDGVRRIDLGPLLQRLGPEVIVRDVRPRLRCSTCGGRNVIISTLWKDATTTERLMEHWK